MTNRTRWTGETAAVHMVVDLPVARPDESVAAVLGRLRDTTYALADSVYVLDAAGRLLGVAALPALLRAPADRPVGQVMVRPAATAAIDEDQERVAGTAIRHDLVAVPVVDARGRFAGVVPPSAIFGVLRREHVEDLHRLAGILHETEQAREAIEEPPLRRVRHRLPWLTVGLAGSILAAFVVSRFEEVLEARIAVAFFVPAIVYLADSIGTQTEAVVVRRLSLGPVRLGRLLLEELRTGFLIGLALGGALFVLSRPILEDPRLAAAIALAVVAAGSVAATIGLLLPWLLDRLGRDPAFGSGPVATVIQDVLSLVIYFLMVRLLVV